jgi:putative ABC transport system substrate-binding protein
MRRREFIALLLGGVAAWPLTVLHAQQTLPTVGILTNTSLLRFVPVSLKGFGWEENRNYRTVYRFAEGHMDRMPALADELVADRVDVIVVATEAGIQAAQRATKTIPIVGVAADLVRTGFAATMARPGANLTGVNILASELDVKRLEILHEAIPAARRIAALALPNATYDTRPELEEAARQLNFELVFIAVPRIEDLNEGLDALQSAHVDAVNVLASPSVTLMSFPKRPRKVDFLATESASNWLPRLLLASSQKFYGAADPKTSRSSSPTGSI